MKKKEGILFKTPCWYIYYSDSQMGANTSMYSKAKGGKKEREVQKPLKKTLVISLTISAGIVSIFQPSLLMKP